MKRMKKLISIRSIPVLALALLIVLGTALEAVPPTKVTGSAGFADSTFLDVWKGTATLYIEGKQGNPFNGTYTVNIFNPTTSKKGVIQGMSYQYFTFTTGEVNSYGTITLEPKGETPGSYNVTQISTIVIGTGDFDDMPGGQLRVKGLVTGYLEGNPSVSSDIYFTVSGSY